MASFNGTNRFVAAWPTKPLHKIATAIRDADWRDLDSPAPRKDWWQPSLGRAIYHRHCHQTAEFQAKSDGAEWALGLTVPATILASADKVIE